MERGKRYGNLSADNEELVIKIASLLTESKTKFIDVKRIFSEVENMLYVSR